MMKARRLLGAGCALLLSAALLVTLTTGFGPVPALGQALNPGRGVWTSDADAKPVRSERLSLPGLRGPVSVRFGESGVSSIEAGSDTDLFEALGYVHARFRLAQMDLQRRLGSGRLAELVGPAAVTSDQAELRLGLRRTAEALWARTPRASASGTALVAYARGVNRWLSAARASHRWPALFSLLGVYPEDWTPVDSLTVQQVLAENLSFTTAPLDYAVLQRSLGAKLTEQFFPVQAPNPQRPYDPGPYRKAAIAPMPDANVNTDVAAQALPAAPAPKTDRGTPRAAQPPATPALSEDQGPAAADHDVLAQISGLPVNVTHRFRDSNAWAANGGLVAHGRAMLAGDPHLQHTLPAYWFETALRSPGYAVSGFTLPGLPGVLIGHNSHVSWSLTNVQNQSALYYREATDSAHPGMYYWRGAWRPMKNLRYRIAVRGGAPVDFTVELTAHGPVMTRVGQTTAVYWTGNIPSPDLESLLAIDRASDFTAFRGALRTWYAPAQNFIYADEKGDIGAVAAGVYPVVAKGQPWLPLPGTGESDVVGSIPYADVPQAYNPPDHMVVSANDRPVGPDYPYYIGTSVGFDYGYRSARIRELLGSRKGMTATDFTVLQHDTTDELATRLLPRVLSALQGQNLSPVERQARDRLAAWDRSMATGSPGAPVWWTFWTDYLSAVFQPWWDAAKVPVHLHHDGLAVSPTQSSLVEALETWTLHDPANPAFTPPKGATRNATDVMRTAFHKAVADLTAKLGPSPARWSWGRLHTREFPSLTQAYGLGYGPVPGDGDPWTVNAADDGMNSDWGPSLRMVIDWMGGSQVSAVGGYPGGQSENPGSPWYRNLLSDWLAGRYGPLPPVTGTAPGSTVWTLRGRG
jgi:penicillin amidase